MTSTEKIQKGVKEAIIAGQYATLIKRVSLFGSYLRGEAKEDSDVDLLIEFMPEAHIGFFQYFDIQDAFENKFKKKVDLLTPEGISPYLREDIINSAKIIYEK